MENFLRKLALIPVILIINICLIAMFIFTNNVDEEVNEAIEGSNLFALSYLALFVVIVTVALT